MCSLARRFYRNCLVASPLLSSRLDDAGLSGWSDKGLAPGSGYRAALSFASLLAFLLTPS